MGHGGVPPCPDFLEDATTLANTARFHFLFLPITTGLAWLTYSLMVSLHLTGHENSVMAEGEGFEPPDPERVR